MAHLAINGGKPLRTTPFPRWPVSTPEERDVLRESAASGRWGHLFCSLFGRITGKVQEFSDLFARYHGVEYAIPVFNGSVALEVALRNAGVGFGNEVITPPTTWVATNLAPVMVGADPVFVDVTPDTYGLDPDRIEEAITPRTKALICVHIGGYPCDMARIMEVAERHGLTVIEDCAQAHGTRIGGRLAGTFGHYGCFSFEISKLMTAGEGGAVITRDASLGDIAFGFCGGAGEQFDRAFAAGRHNVGWNYRMTEFQAALLIGQLSRLEEQRRTRVANAEHLRKRLVEIEGIAPLRQSPEQNYFSYLFKYDKRFFRDVPKDVFMKSVVAEGVPLFSSPSHQPPAYRSPNFFSPRRSYGSVFCPVAERAFAEEAVGLQATWMLLGDRSDMDSIADAIAKVKTHAEELVSLSDRRT